MKALLDWIYPRSCQACGEVSPDPLRYLCWDCLCDTPRVEPPFCALCGDPVPGCVEHRYICYACGRKVPAFDKARSAVRYDGAAGKAVRDLKYHHALWMTDDLVQMLGACVEAEYSSETLDVVTAVPLYPARQRERGFNQSALLGKELARRLGLPFRSGLLHRVRPTVTQTGLTAVGRAANVGGAFRTGRILRLEGKRILLVDDVMTTGATVNACAAVLKRGGAASVLVATVARG